MAKRLHRSYDLRKTRRPQAWLPRHMVDRLLAEGTYMVDAWIDDADRTLTLQPRDEVEAPNG